MPIPQIPSKLISKSPNGLVQILPETAVDAALTEGSANPVSGGAVSAALEDISEALGLHGRLHVVDGELTADIVYDYSNESLIVNLEPEVWSFELATGEDGKGAVPFNLYYVQDFTLHVDWGDGTESDLDKTSYQISDSSASIHEYSEPGRYLVKASARNWSSASILTILSPDLLTSSNSNEATEAIRIWRTTASSIAPLPRLRGNSVYLSLTSNRMLLSSLNSLAYAFCQCAEIKSVPEDLLSDMPDAENFTACFRGCSKLAALPQNLFAANAKAKTFKNCFADCSALGGFDIRIASEIVENAEGFVDLKNGVSRTVRVPSGSATQDAFDAVASDLGLTVVGE